MFVIILLARSLIYKVDPHNFWTIHIAHIQSIKECWNHEECVKYQKKKER